MLLSSLLISYGWLHYSSLFIILWFAFLIQIHSHGDQELPSGCGQHYTCPGQRVEKVNAIHLNQMQWKETCEAFDKHVDFVKHWCILISCKWLNSVNPYDPYIYWYNQDSMNWNLVEKVQNQGMMDLKLLRLLIWYLESENGLYLLIDLRGVKGIIKSIISMYSRYHNVLCIQMGKVFTVFYCLIYFVFIVFCFICCVASLLCKMCFVIFTFVP